MRILYIHGLESGPKGRKTQALREAGFEVVALEMPCSRKHLLRDPLLISSVALGLALFAYALTTRSTSALGALLGLLLLARFCLPSLLMRRAFAKSIRVQELGSQARLLEVQDDHRLSKYSNAEQLGLWMSSLLSS